MRGMHFFAGLNALFYGSGFETLVVREKSGPKTLIKRQMS
jgi:hypothetical protein